jgi:hypothetical protein
VWQIVVNFLTKRIKDSTPEHECIEGLMSVLQKEMGGELGTSASDVWKLRKALHGYAGSSRLWWDKVSGWLRSYVFRALGNSGTFMVLDRRDADEESRRGIILPNLYSDDGLASIDNSTLYDRFMLEFKRAFDVVEKDPDYFLGCAIEWDPETGVIQLDASK